MNKTNNKETNIGNWGKLLHEMPESYKNYFQEEEKYLREYISNGSKVLDVGCGEGRSLEYILDKDCKIHGIDNDKKAVSDSIKKFHNNSNVSIELGDGRDLNYKDNSFDYVISLITPVNFNKDRNKFYSEMKRVVKKDGEIILSVYNEDAFLERMKVYKKFGGPIKEIIGTKVVFKNIDGAGTSEQFSRYELKEIFNENKLNEIEIRKCGIVYFCRVKK